MASFLVSCSKTPKQGRPPNPAEQLALVTLPPSASFTRVSLLSFQDIDLLHVPNPFHVPTRAADNLSDTFSPPHLMG